MRPRTSEFSSFTVTNLDQLSESEKNHLLANAPNMSLEGVVYHASTVAGAAFKPLYRFYLPAKGFHFYTASEAEKNSLIATAAATYTYEGPAYYVLGNNQAPTVNLTAPAAGASHTTPVSIAISASADDVDGQVSRVEFYSGATLLGTVPGPTSSAASYTFTWANAPAGTHTLTARATDSHGAVSASAAITITVVTLPPVVFGGPLTEHLYNGAAQRTVRVQPEQQSVYVYGQEGHTVLAEVQRNLSTNVLTTTEHIYLPTASGPMPVAVVLNGAHYAVHTDHLGTPRRLTNSAGQPVWQWAFSGFGELPAQALPPAGQTPVSYNLRYPGQVDDGNGLFYNWHRFYDPSSGRYTSADPIGLEGGWNRFGYVGGNPLLFIDPMGLQVVVGGSTGGLGGAGSSGAVGGSAGRAESLTRLIDATSTAWNRCKCMPATAENIQPVLNSSPMLTLQPTISVRAVQSWVSEYEAGIPVPPIQVDGNIIVDGNHRYVASLLCGKPPGIQPWTAPLTRPRMPMRDLQIQP